MNQKPKIMVGGILTVYGVYEMYKSEIMRYGSRSWNTDTTSQYDSVVINHLIPYLPGHDIKHIGMFTKQDYETALDHLIKAGKNKPGEPFKAWDADGIPEKVSYLMRAIVWSASEHMLCDNVFGPREIYRSGGKREGTGEQLARNKKSLTVKEELAVHQYIMRHMENTNPDAGLALMYAFGLRNNDACGVNFGYIREFADYPGNYYLIVPQSTELGANTVKILGKSRNSGRRIPMPTSLARRLFLLREKRAELARARGYKGKPEDLPIACREGKPTERCCADDLSMAAKKMYEKIGMRMEDIVALNQDLLEELQAVREEFDENEFQEIERDPTAYLLRRSFATIVAVLGMTDAEIRYVVGHKIDDEYIQRRAFGDEKMLFRIKQKMDQRPLLNDIQLEKELTVLPGKNESLSGSKGIVLNLPADQLSCVRINVAATEPGDEIRFKILYRLDTGCISADFVSFNRKPSDEVRRTTDIMRYYHRSFRV